MQRGTRMKNKQNGTSKGLWDKFKRCNIHIIETPGGRGKNTPQDDYNQKDSKSWQAYVEFGTLIHCYGNVKWCSHFEN